MKKRLAIIDLDTILYIVAHKQFEAGNRDNKENVKNHVKEYISAILLNSRAEFVSMVYQEKGHSNFRKYFYVDYKANRPPAPEFITVWKDYITEVYKEIGAVGVKVIESDDVNRIGWYKYKDEYEVITVTSDKDANQIPGLHYNPKSHTMVEITEELALKNLWMQTLTGDKGTDNIRGIEGLGPKTAEKLVEGCVTSNDYWIVACRAYMKAYPESCWFSELRKTVFLIQMLKEVDYTYYPFTEEVTELFNIIPCSDLVVSNLFY